MAEVVNLKLIRNALKDAASAINTDHDLKLHAMIDEATREVAGSPNIADSIFEKIRGADVFVCDLTKVAEVQNEAGEARKYCNTNVALELGYAVRVLGWNRIIIVFNEGYGIIPDDLPFDARGHRASPYRCRAELEETGRPTPACQSQISNASGRLRTTLIDGLKLIAKENPKRPQELEVKSPEEIRRERDVEQLERVFYWLHLDVLDEFIERLGHGCITMVGTEFHEALSTVVKSVKYHFSDVEMRLRFEAFFKAWTECFRYAHDMDLRSNGKEAHFNMPCDAPRSAEQFEQFRYTTAQAAPLRAALDSLLEYVRENYLEIDPSSCGREALCRYREART